VVRDAGGGAALSFTVYYASDIHGSDRLWRKFVNAGTFYGADVLVMGGDITGKAVVPMIRHDGGVRVPELIGDRVAALDELEQLEGRIRDRGFYPYLTTEEELAAAHGDQSAVAELFRRAMADSVRRWLELAEERLAGTGIRLYMMLGNDDEPALQEVLAASPLHVDCEDLVVDLPGGIQMLSCGIANPTPWDSPRELPRTSSRRTWRSSSADWTTPAAASSICTCRRSAPPWIRRPSSIRRSSRSCGAGRCR
jgi:Icc-related predicted phosphoesterase